MADYMQQLIDAGRTGADLSPGDPAAKWAAETITELRARIAQLQKDNSRLVEDNLTYCRQHLEKVQCIRKLETDNQRLSAENAGLRVDRDRIDWMELKGWVPDYSEVNETVPTRTLRACIDAARGGK